MKCAGAGSRAHGTGSSKQGLGCRVVALVTPRDAGYGGERGMRSGIVDQACVCGGVSLGEPMITGSKNMHRVQLLCEGG